MPQASDLMLSTSPDTSLGTLPGVSISACASRVLTRGGLQKSFVLFGITLGLVTLLGAMLCVHREVLGVDIMEARNLITAHEMIETGHWFLPTLHGEPRLAKPPLPTWITATVMLLGNGGQDTNLAVNRIPSALAALLLAGSLFGLTRFWSKSTEVAAWSTAFLATSYMLVFMARRNSWDIYCHAFMLAAIWALAVIAASPLPRPKLALGAGVLLGLSGLSKGPVSYYALLLPWIIALVATGGWRGVRLRVRDLGVALGVGLVLSVSWPIMAWLAMPHEFSSMLTTEGGAWFSEHTKPFWFYLQFPFMTGVWSLVACAALWPGHARSRVEPLVHYWRPALWALGSVGLLMLVPEKKDRYLLPVLVPLCQLMGIYVTGLLRDPEAGGRFGRVLMRVNSVIFGLLCAGVPLGLWWLRGRFPSADPVVLVGVSVLAVLCAGLIFNLCRVGSLRWLFGVKFAVLGLLVAGVPALVHFPSGDLSVPVATIRAMTAATPVLGDTSLKLQDSWIVGRKVLSVDDLAELENAERVCFVSRAKDFSVPDILRDYTVCDRLDVFDFSGQPLTVVVLRRTR